MTATSTRAAPAAFSARAQPSTVAPVVFSQQTNKIDLFKAA
jgi:hypothetical protein